MERKLVGGARRAGMEDRTCDTFVYRLFLKLASRSRSRYDSESGHWKLDVLECEDFGELVEMGVAMK
jgi:hypothetical protein